MAFLVLGCGYTGERVARRLLERGARVHATTRDPARLAHLAERGALVSPLEISNPGSIAELARLLAPTDREVRVLCSIPPPRTPPRAGLADLLRALGLLPVRVVYLSSTAVYGEATVVDEHTPAAPCDEAGRLRLEAEQAAARGPWSTLALRVAAIYGAHRGVHVLLRLGTLGRVRELDQVVSRVHVDDLAAICEAALLSTVSGEFPVADDEPATTREVAAFCRQLGLPALPPRGPGERAAIGHRGRRVDGRMIRNLLQVQLRYPSYRTGIPAAIREESLDEGAPIS
jgi:nucleoside-diphosphate-sugar epimerase